MIVEINKELGLSHTMINYGEVLETEPKAFIISILNGGK
jgi:hypothetical protein